MLYTRLGDTGLIVSKMAFGAMTFGKPESWMATIAKVDQAGADALVARSLDVGVNFFNTADGYADGESEIMLGRALASRRQDVVIATKVGFRTGQALVRQGLSRHHILASAEGSLRRLATDYLDVYLVHKVDPYTPLDETLEALESLVREGKVRYVGFSNWPAWLAAKAVGIQRANGWEPFRAAEVYYSLVGRDVEHEIVPFALDAGIGLTIWSPLASGFLSGKYTRANPSVDGGRLTGFDFIPFDRDQGYAVVDCLRMIATAHHATPAQIALAWLMTRPAVASVLVGATRMSQLDDNLGAAALSVTAAELAALDQLTDPGVMYPNWFNAKTGDAPVADALSRSV